jgi:hypothetical protein
MFINEICQVEDSLPAIPVFSAEFMDVDSEIFKNHSQGLLEFIARLHHKIPDNLLFLVG